MGVMRGTLILLIGPTTTEYEDNRACLLQTELRFVTTSRVHTPQGPIGNQLLPIFFEAEDERYRWLNNAVCILEGTIKERPTTGPGRPQQVGSGRVFTCVNELVS